MAAAIPAQQLVNLKKKLAATEKCLRAKLTYLQRLLPALADIHLTPNASMNTSYDVPPTPQPPSASTDRRDERGAGQPYFLGDQKAELLTAHEAFSNCIDELMAVLDINDQLYEKLMVKFDHYSFPFEEAKRAVENRT